MRVHWRHTTTGSTAATALLLVAIVAAAAWPAPVTIAADGDHVLCVPEAPPPPQAATFIASEVPVPVVNAQGLPFTVVVPGVTRVEDAPVEPGPSPAMLALEARLAGLVDTAGIPGLFAVAVTDLQTGETIGVGLDRRQRSGCVMNLFVIIAALRDVDAGRYPLATVDATIRQTIRASDATAAHHLYRVVGGGDAVAGVRAVSELLAALGMADSVIDHPPAFVNDSIGVDPNNLVTARDVNRALERLYRGEVLSTALTAYLLEAMTQVSAGLNYLTAVVPAPGVVSHKNGFFWDSEGWVDNDTSIVRFDGHAYALTFLSEAVPVLYSDIPLARALVLETWEHFRLTYR